MTGQRGLIACVVATVLAGSGCVCCGNKSYEAARVAGPDCDIPECRRNQVYVFVMSGLNPVEMLAVESLRGELNKQGYSKIATGQTVHAGWMGREMRRIRANEPDSVFVVLGAESGGPEAVKLAVTAAADGLPIAAVVVVDATGMTAPPSGTLRTLTIGMTEGVAAAGSGDAIVVPTPGRLGLTGDSRTAVAVAQLLHELAPPATVVTGASPPWTYPHAPSVRPEGDATLNPEWAFLFDQPGAGVPPAGTAVVPAQPTTSNASTDIRP